MQEQIVDGPTVTSFTDGFQVANREDGIIYLQLLSKAPDKLFENHRTVMPIDCAKGLIDKLCVVTNYYPVKSKNKSGSSGFSVGSPHR